MPALTTDDACRAAARSVIEIDAAGQQVWSWPAWHGVFAQRLENGNTLVCSVRVPQVRESDRRATSSGPKATRQP
jgi:hypothetical protein